MRWRPIFFLFFLRQIHSCTGLWRVERIERIEPVSQPCFDHFARGVVRLRIQKSKNLLAVRVQGVEGFGDLQETDARTRAVYGRLSARTALTISLRNSA